MVILLITSSSFAQYKIEGKLVNSENKNLEFIEVILMTKDSIPFESVLSDEFGKFKIISEKGFFILQIRSVGNILLTKNIHIEGDLDLGEIGLNDANTLEEVTIISKKKIIELKADRLVYKFSNDSLLKGSNLLDALHKVPRLEINQDKISIIGKDGSPTIMINGRIQNMSVESLKAKLKNLKADDIEQVEIIPTPPSKYSAQGNNGMINLILKKDANNGLFTSINSGVNYQNKKFFYNSGVSANFKKNNFETTASFNFMNIRGVNTIDETYDFTSSQTIINRESTFDFKNFSSDFTAQYKISDRILIGTNLNYYRAPKIPSTSEVKSEYFNKILQIKDSLLDSKSVNFNNGYGYTYSFFSDFVLDSIGKKVSLTYNRSINQYNKDSNSDEFVFDANQNELRNYSYQNDGENKYDIQSVLLDVEIPIKTHKIELGGACTNISNHSKIDFQNTFYPILNQYDFFEYHEKTSAGYISFNSRVNKLNYKLGLRLENTNFEGFSTNLDISNHKTYSKLFPTLYTSYSPNDNHSFSLSYGKRLDRPSFYDFNPFHFYNNLYAYTTGNPQLLPVYTDSFEFSYNYKGKLNFNSYYNYKTDGISYKTVYENDNVLKTTPINDYKQNKFGVVSSYSDKLLKKLEYSLSANTYYILLKHYSSTIENEGFGGNTSVYISYNFKGNGNSVLGTYYTYFFPSNDEYTTESFSDLSMNFKQLLFKQKLTLNIWFSDILGKNIYKNERKYENFIYYSKYNIHVARSISVSLNYNFGNKNVGGAYRDTKNYDKSRGGK